MIELPDDLFLKVEVLAAERQTTLKDIVIQALNRFTQPTVGAEESRRQAMGQRLLAALQVSNTEPIVPLSREEIYDRGVEDHP